MVYLSTFNRQRKDCYLHLLTCELPTWYLCEHPRKIPQQILRSAIDMRWTKPRLISLLQTNNRSASLFVAIPLRCAFTSWSAKWRSHVLTASSADRKKYLYLSASYRPLYNRLADPNHRICPLLAQRESTYRQNYFPGVSSFSARKVFCSTPTTLNWRILESLFPCYSCGFYLVWAWAKSYINWGSSG